MTKLGGFQSACLSIFAASAAACGPGVAEAATAGAEPPESAAPSAFFCDGRWITVVTSARAVPFMCNGGLVTVGGPPPSGQAALPATSRPAAKAPASLTAPILQIPTAETASATPVDFRPQRTIVMTDPAGGGDQPPAPATTTTTTSAPSSSTTQTTTTISPPKPQKGALSASDFYVGAGFAVSQTVGSERADDVKFITRSDGRLLAQIQTSQNRSIGAMFETHYLLKNQGIFRSNRWLTDENGKQLTDNKGNLIPETKPIDRLASLFACGPFAFIGEDSNRLGCGPLFTAIMDNDGKISQFGVGWALGLGAQPKNGVPDSRAGFGVGLGLLFDTAAKTLDGNIVDLNTKLVRPEFQTAVAGGSISALVNRPTTSLFLMVSKTFN